MRRLKENLVPPPGLPTRLAFQSLLFGIGQGAFITGSAVYFTKMVGLQPWEIGVGLSLASAAGMLTGVPLSAVVDRHGPRMIWCVTSFVSALLFLLFPVVHGFWAFAALVVSMELVATMASSGRNVYMIEALEPETRVLTLAFERSWLNIGWGVGAATAGVALAVDTAPGYHMMVFINAGIIAVNAFMIYRLPTTRHESAPKVRHKKRMVFRDRPYITVSGLVATLRMHTAISLEVAPLWLITHTDAPKWMLAVMAGVNTAMATTLQVAMTRGSHTISGGRRVMRWAGWAGAACCPVFWWSGLTSDVATVILLLLATVLVTLAEMWQSAAGWTLMAELAPADRRGEYVGMARTLGSAQRMIAPAALIALAVTTGGWGWFVIAGLFLVAAAAGGPAVNWAARTRPTSRTDLSAVAAAGVG